MKKNLFYLACCFVFMWTLGEVFNATYREKLVQALSMTFACAIYLGLHIIYWKKLKVFCINVFKISR